MLETIMLADPMNEGPAFPWKPVLIGAGVVALLFFLGVAGGKPKRYPSE